MAHCFSARSKETKQVVKALCQKEFFNSTLIQFMRERSHESVHFVIKAFLVEEVLMQKHIDSVHERKKTDKCSNCDYNCSEKVDLKKNIDSVHEENDALLARGFQGNMNY